MVKRLLLSAGGDDFEWFVERTRNGNRYYMKELRKREYIPVSEKEMRDAIKSDIEQYGYVQYYGGTDGEEERENFMRIRKLAPELLPKLVEITEYKGDSWKVVPDDSFCPPGYKFIPVKKPKRLKDGAILKGYCKLI